VLINGFKDDYSYEKKIIDAVISGDVEAFANRQTLQENRLIVSQLIENPEYQQELILLQPLQAMQLPLEQKNYFLDALEKELENDRLRGLQGRDASPAENEHAKILLSKFPFLPKSSIEEMVKPFFQDQKILLLQRLITLFTILNAVKPDIQSTDLLLEKLRVDEEEHMLLEFSGFRLDENEQPQYIAYLNQVLPRLWSVESIVNNQTFSTFQHYIGTLSTADQHRILVQLYASMRNSPDLAIYLDPIDQQYVLRRMQAMNSDTELPAFLQEMLELIEDQNQKPLAEAVIRLFFKITHTYPEPK